MVGAVAGALLALFPSAAQSAGGGLLERPRLTGDWGGVRTRLEERGVDLFGRYLTGAWANLHGGFATGVRYEGFANWGADLDLEEMLDWKGGRFHIDWISYHGGQPSTDLVGQFPASALSGYEARHSLRFFEIFLEQSLARGRVEVKIGQIVADRDFFVSEYSEVFRNANLGTFSAGRADPTQPFYPLAVPGAVVTLRSGGHWRGRVAVYTADPGRDEPDNIGFDWGFDNGATLFADVTFEHHRFGLPAAFTLGAGFSNARTPAVDATIDENQVFYAVVDQALIADSQGAAKLGGFVRAIHGPRTDRSLLHWYVDAGLRWQGVVGRERDALGAAVVWTQFSREYVDAIAARGQDVSDEQLFFELTWRARLADWLQIQPSLQIFFDPHLSRRDAVALGLHAFIDF